MVTELRLLILGLLARRPRSGYALGKALAELPTSPFTGSPGAVYPALRAMEQEGLIRKRTIGSPGRPAYEPSADGRARLEAWLTGPIDPWDLVRSPGTVTLMVSFVDGESDRMRLKERIVVAATGLLDHLTRYERAAAEELAASSQEGLDLVVALLRAYLEWAPPDRPDAHAPSTILPLGGS